MEAEMGSRTGEGFGHSFGTPRTARQYIGLQQTSVRAMRKLVLVWDIAEAEDVEGGRGCRMGVYEDSRS